MQRRTLEELSWDECFALLAEESVGRLVYVDELGPAAVPINYALAGHDIVFCSEKGSKIRGLQDDNVAFEVDHIDHAPIRGSVLVRGTSRVVENDQIIGVLKRIDGDPPLPWKKGVHTIWVVIEPKTVTGRSLEDLVSEDLF
jgi:nitroimidazol reductase NimA-like FMN-containing flavoprotein (pyridoxamine 5'-phosphate oxidase superfamily)